MNGEITLHARLLEVTETQCTLLKTSVHDADWAIASFQVGDPDSFFLFLEHQEERIRQIKEAEESASLLWKSLEDQNETESEENNSADLQNPALIQLQDKQSELRDLFGTLKDRTETLEIMAKAQTDQIKLKLREISTQKVLYKGYGNKSL